MIAAMTIQAEFTAAADEFRRPDLEFDLADRMRKSLRVADIGVQEMADYLEVQRATVGRWINGHTSPSTATVKLWALRTGVPYEWLRGTVKPRPAVPNGADVRPEGFEPPTF